MYLFLNTLTKSSVKLFKISRIKYPEIKAQLPVYYEANI